MSTRQSAVSLAKDVLRTERDAIDTLLERVDDHFQAACEILLSTQAKVVVIGMGKSGHIASKLAATLASTGTPAFFVHPGEASHGDLGMIASGDSVVALSNSGETQELVSLLPTLKRLSVPMVALTGDPGSTLAQHADVHIDVSVEREACPLGLAPTASTTAALAMGDALAVALLSARGFTSEDFARSHPGGSLGRRLLLLIEDVMHVGDKVPRSKPGDTLASALVEMSAKGLGMTIVVDDDERILGVFTDGDLRRTLDKRIDPHETSIHAIMTASPHVVQRKALAIEAARLMQSYDIHNVPVIDDSERLCGALSIHDLMRTGVV